MTNDSDSVPVSRISGRASEFRGRNRFGFLVIGGFWDNTVSLGVPVEDFLRSLLRLGVMPDFDEFVRELLKGRPRKAVGAFVLETLEGAYPENLAQRVWDDIESRYFSRYIDCEASDDEEVGGG